MHALTCKQNMGRITRLSALFLEYLKSDVSGVILLYTSFVDIVIHIINGQWSLLF